MKKHDKPPRRRLRDKPDEPAGKVTPENDPGPEQQPADAARSEKTPAEQERPSGSDNPSKEELITAWTKPVTNQDEQEKITNAEGDIPVANQ